MKPFDLNDSLLGKKLSHSDKYDASLLFRIPREENRVHYGLDSDNLPFVGFDVWNCYEVSFLTDNGLPVSRVLKMVYPANSQYLVESKSLKLYLNSFNMDKFGKTVVEAEETVRQTISRDLNELLETQVRISLFNNCSKAKEPFSIFARKDVAKMLPMEKLEAVEFDQFNESPALLKSKPTNEVHEYLFYSDLLRSNCRVTNQPDWGDLFVRISTMHEIDLSSVVEYLVSFRKENHFHEEVVEMIYKRFHDHFSPRGLMIAAMYTRRGGIDINPIRASHAALLDESLIDASIRSEKRMRQ